MSALGRRVNLREVAEDVSDVRARQAHEESRDLSRLLCRLGGNRSGADELLRRLIELDSLPGGVR